MFTSFLGTEILYSTAILFCILLLANSCRLRSFLSTSVVFATGLLLGFSHWIRPTAPLFIIPGALFLALTPGMIRVKVRSFCFILFGVLFAVAPLMWLNKRAIGIASPMPSHEGGWSLLTGTEPEFRGHCSTQAAKELNEELNRRVNPGIHPQLFRDRVAREMAIQRIRNNPISFVRLVLLYKIPDLWALSSNLIQGMKGPGVSFFAKPLLGLGMIYHSMVIMLCSVLIFRRYRLNIFKWSVLTVYVYAALATTVVHFFVEVQARYHHMFLPLIAIFCGFCLFPPNNVEGEKPQIESRSSNSIKEGRFVE
ncbi:MAG: hypothetical protein ACYSWP_23380 [Planctomycetota bacterium]